MQGQPTYRIKTDQRGSVVEVANGLSNRGPCSRQALVLPAQALAQCQSR